MVSHCLSVGTGISRVPRSTSKVRKLTISLIFCEPATRYQSTHKSRIRLWIQLLWTFYMINLPWFFRNWYFSFIVFLCSPSCTFFLHTTTVLSVHTPDLIEKITFQPHWSSPALLWPNMFSPQRLRHTTKFSMFYRLFYFDIPWWFFILSTFNGLSQFLLWPEPELIQMITFPSPNTIWNSYFMGISHKLCRLSERKYITGADWNRYGKIGSESFGSPQLLKIVYKNQSNQPWKYILSPFLSHDLWVSPEHSSLVKACGHDRLVWLSRHGMPLQPVSEYTSRIRNRGLM